MLPNPRESRQSTNSYLPAQDQCLSAGLCLARNIIGAYCHNLSVLNEFIVVQLARIRVKRVDLPLSYRDSQGLQTLACTRTCDAEAITGPEQGAMV